MACGHYKVYTLYRCSPDGGDIRKISSNALIENTPWVLPDGRVLFTRWEYVDRHQMRYQHLWTINPDGTGVMVYYGNQFPGNVYLDAKPIPGTQNIVYVDSPGHGLPDHQGVLTVVAPRTGPDDRTAAHRLDLGPQYAGLQGRCYDPYPLGEDRFLFACDRSVYFTDGKGTTELLYTLPGTSGTRMILQDPRPLRGRGREPRIPSRVNLSHTTGTLVLQDVYHVRNMAGVRRGEIKKLLVLEQLPKPANYLGWQRPVTLGCAPNNGGAFTYKRILGTVPVESGGSAYFKAPAMRSLFFIALDEKNQSVKRMQSFSTLQPGEVTTCVGCHENRTVTPGTSKSGSPLALRRDPSAVASLPGIPDIFDFPRDIQPILDRHCAACYGYEATDKGGPRAGGVILTGDRGGFFSHAYATLTLRRQFADARNDHGDRPPRSIGASASPLMDKLDVKHHNVAVSDAERDLIRYWIESGAAYPGTATALGTGMVGMAGDGEAYDKATGIYHVRYPTKVLRARCLTCHALPMEAMDHYPPEFENFANPHLLFNLSKPEHSLILLAPLSRQAGGFGLCGPKDADAATSPAGIFADTNDADYRALLETIRTAATALNRVKRFDMPGFVPRPEYFRELKNYGVLSNAFDPARDAFDIYQLDKAYYRSQWHEP